MVGIELRRYAKFQVYIFKTDSGKKARGEAGSCLILPIYAITIFLGYSSNPGRKCYIYPSRVESIPKFSEKNS